MSLGKIPGYYYDPKKKKYFRGAEPPPPAVSPDASGSRTKSKKVVAGRNSIAKILSSRELGLARGSRRQWELDLWEQLFLQNVEQQTVYSYFANCPRKSVNADGVFVTFEPLNADGSQGFELRRPNARWHLVRCSIEGREKEILRDSYLFPLQFPPTLHSEWLDKGENTELCLTVNSCSDLHDQSKCCVLRTSNGGGERGADRSLQYYDMSSFIGIPIELGRNVTLSGSSKDLPVPHFAISSGRLLELQSMHNDRCVPLNLPPSLSFTSSEITDSELHANMLMCGTRSGRLIFADTREPFQSLQIIEGSCIKGRGFIVDLNANGHFVVVGKTRPLHPFSAAQRKRPHSQYETGGQLFMLDLRMPNQGPVAVFSGHQNSHRRFQSSWSTRDFHPLLCGGDDMRIRAWDHRGCGGQPFASYDLSASNCYPQRVGTAAQRTWIADERSISILNQFH